MNCIPMHRNNQHINQWHITCIEYATDSHTYSIEKSRLPGTSKCTTHHSSPTTPEGKTYKHKPLKLKGQQSSQLNTSSKPLTIPSIYSVGHDLPALVITFVPVPEDYCGAIMDTSRMLITMKSIHIKMNIIDHPYSSVPIT